MSCEKLCNGSHRSPVFGVGHGDVAMSSEADRGRCGGLWAAARWTPEGRGSRHRATWCWPAAWSTRLSDERYSEADTTAKTGRRGHGVAHDRKASPKEQPFRASFPTNFCDHDGVDFGLEPNEPRRRGFNHFPTCGVVGRGVPEHRAQYLVRETSLGIWDRMVSRVPRARLLSTPRR